MSQPICILCAFYHPQADTHAPDPGWLTCASGFRRLEQDLLSLRAAYLRLVEEVTAEVGAGDLVSLMLPAAPTASPSAQPRVSGSRDRRLPIDTAKIDLLLPVVPGYVRDPHRDQTGHPSAASVLNEWVAEWHDRWCPYESYPRTTAPSLIDWILAARLHLACRGEEALADFAQEIGALRGRLRSALGELEPKKAIMWGVPCPRCKLTSQLQLNPEDPDRYRVCASCGVMLTHDDYLRHLRALIEVHRSDLAPG